MKKRTTILYLTPLLVGNFLFANTADKEQGPDFHPKPGTNRDIVLKSFTEGDQTDVYAIPFDDDQLGQYEELEEFEKESKEYEEKEKGKAAKKTTKKSRKIK